MSVKTLCPRCKTEIVDPAQFNSLTCPSCKPSPWKMSVPWMFAAALCATVLVALWIAAWKMKTAKVAARMNLQDPAPLSAAAVTSRLRVGADRLLGGTEARTLAEYFARWAKDHPGREADVEIDPASPSLRQQEVLDEARKHQVPVRFVAGDSGRARLVLRRGDRLKMESFTLQFWLSAENVSVYNAGGTHCVEFDRIQKGERRAWQELQLTFLDVEKDALAMEAELKPGAACFGRGFYRHLKAGLRIEFPRDRSLTVLDWDPVKPSLKLRFDGSGQSLEETLGEKGEKRVLAITCRLLPAPDKDFMLLVDDLD